jgi:GT2 family glycosyltransferase
MDADDVMHRDRLAAQLEALESDRGLTAVGCHVRVVPRTGLRAGWRAYERWLNAIRSPDAVRAEAFVECPVVHPTLMIRRPVLEAFGYRDEGWPEDYDLVLRLLQRGARIGVVPRRLLAWRDHSRRLTRTDARYSLARHTACKASFLARGFLARSEGYVLWGHGGTGRALRRALLAHGKRPSAVVEVHPGRLGQRIGGAPVVPPDALERLPRRPLVVSVAGVRPRTEIRAALEAMGFRETVDFLCAA